MSLRPGPRVGLIPALILLGVAVGQLVLAHGAGLSPWLGGGFGMFSTLDSAGSRHIHIFVLEPGREHEIFPPGEALQEHAARARALPTDFRLRAHAQAVAKAADFDRARATGLRVQLWKTSFDPETLVPSDRIVRQSEMPLDGG